MRISPQPIKRKGKITGWRFIYYDVELSKPRYLKKSDHPELRSITSKKESVDFANKWNAKATKKKAEVKAKRKRELYSERFDFINSLDDFKEYQAKLDKSYTSVVYRVELVLNRLINIHMHGHPVEFKETSYREVLLTIKEERSLNEGGLKKYRTAFNTFMGFLYQSNRIDYEQVREIPISTLRLVERTAANQHGKKASTLGISVPEQRRPARKVKKIKRLKLKQLIKLLDFSIKYPEIIPEKIGRLYFIAGTVGLRRGALLALQRRHIEIRDNNRMYIVPDQTIQRFERDGSSEYMIDEPDHIKDVPHEIPVWLDRTVECINWWLHYSSQYSTEDDAWLFPSDRPWSPKGRKGTPLAAGKLPMYPDSISRPFRKYVVAAGLPDMEYRNLRHSAANIIAELTDIETAGELLGHKSTKTTQKYYLDREVIQNAIQLYRFDACPDKLWAISETIRKQEAA